MERNVIRRMTGKVLVVEKEERGDKGWGRLESM